MGEARSIFDIVDCVVRTSLDDLVLFLAFHQPMPGVTPPLFEKNGRVYVPLGIGLAKTCLLEAVVGGDASKKYLHIIISRSGIEYRFSDTPPESMDVKVYPIIHLEG